MLSDFGRILKTAIVGATTLVSIAIAGSAGAVNLVQNGTFTATSASSPGDYICSGSAAACAVASNITAWTSTCDAITCGTHSTPDSLLFAGTNGSAFNGNIGLYSATDAPLGGNIVALDGAPQYSAKLSQTIGGLTVGSSYVLSFYEAGAQQKGQNGATTEDFKVTFGGDSLTSALVNTPDKGFSGWTLQTLTFKASAASEVLSFLGQGTPSGEPPIALLGDVSLNAVPEPASWALMIVGVAGLGGALRTRRNADLALGASA